MKTPYHHTARPPHRAFTLIELLAVIAIIGVLAALIISVLSKVRMHAARIQSVSNLKQFGIAYLSFANDNKNRLPPSMCYGSSSQLSAYGFDQYSDGKGWDYWLLPYVGYTVGSGYGNLTNSNRPKGSLAEGLFSHRRDQGTGTNGSRRTYAANAVYPGGATPVFHTTLGSGTVRKWTILTDIKRPSRLILLSEFSYANGTIGKADCAGLVPSFQVALTEGKPDLNPNGKYNYLFADGHVKTMRLEETYRAFDTQYYRDGNGGSRLPTGTGASDLWRDEDLTQNASIVCPFLQQGWQ